MPWSKWSVKEISGQSASAPSSATAFGKAGLAATFVLTSLSFQAMADQAADLRGPARIIDGDSLEVAGRVFDLPGIDAPELDQRCRRKERDYPCGSLAQAALMDLTAGVDVVCRRLSDQKARCSAGGYDLSEGMIYTGWALIPPANAGSPFATLQQQAEERQHGLWKGSFVTPWDWRQGQRLPGEADN
ncbi:thermonuclease family protein [Pelagibius sp.]|uniref:thermonuclease family protein n=1 Tax=Pelagibius sp. TaxID=1931238 RepID=UPI003BB09361